MSKSLQDKMRELLAGKPPQAASNQLQGFNPYSNSNPLGVDPNLPSQKSLQTLQAEHDRRTVSMPSPEVEAAQRKAMVLKQLDDAVHAQRRAMQSIAAQLPDLLKGFSPTALAKVIARDAELTDLVTKALFLVPAYTLEKSDDRPSGS